GGYSDMVAQRGYGIGGAPAAKERKALARSGSTPRPVAKTSGAKRKLSFAEQHALKTLPEKIERLSAEIARLEARLAAPDIYVRDPAGFTAATKADATAVAGRAAAEEEWLRVELIREEIAG
ncbi:MAG: ABC transporter ATP-binding protein, partial [Bauldia sp.]